MTDDMRVIADVNFDCGLSLYEMARQMLLDNSERSREEYTTIEQMHNAADQAYITAAHYYHTYCEGATK